MLTFFKSSLLLKLRVSLSFCIILQTNQYRIELIRLNIHVTRLLALLATFISGIQHVRYQSLSHGQRCRAALLTASN